MKEPNTPTWEPVSAIIQSAKPVLDYIRKDSLELLSHLDKKFAPLQDPFRYNFQTNRWFSGEREEGYSDWLAWILEQLPDNLIFDLLKIENKYCRKNMKKSVRREYHVEKGHEGKRGKLDILIEYPHNTLITIELKMGYAESADIEKQKGYKESLEKNSLCPNRFYRLIVTEAQKAEYHGFEVIKWRDMCLGLCKIAAGHDREDIHGNGVSAMTDALILAFVGAVEQNVIKYPYFSESSYSFDFNSDVKSYFTQFLEVQNEE